MIANTLRKTENIGASLASRLRTQYGLAHELFSRSVFFAGARRAASLEHLAHLAEFGDLVLLVSGDRGMGKTALVAEFVRRYRGQLTLVPLGADRLLTPQHLVTELLPRLGLTLGASESVENALRRFFNASEAHNPRMVLLLDDADRVPGEILSLLLSGFCQGNRAKGAVPFLAGPPEMASKLSVTVQDDGQDGFLAIPLAPLSREELDSFLQEVFAAAGGRFDSKAERKKLDQLFAMSHGQPGRIRRMTAGLLLGSPSSGARFTIPKWPEITQFLVRYWRFLAIGGLLLSASWLWMLSQYATKNAESKVAASPGLSAPEGRTRSIIQLSANSPLPEPVMDAAASRAAEARVPPAPLVQESTLPVDPVPVSASVVMTDVTDAEAVDEEVLEPESEPADLAVNKSAPVVAKPALVEPVVESVRPAAPVKPSAPAKAVAPAKESPAPSVRQLRSVDWLKSRNSKHFTVQLLGSYSEATIQKLLRQYSQLDLVYVKVTYKSQPWFVVLMGDYPSRAAANSAVSQLPERLRKDGSWVRDFAGLKASAP